MNAILYNGQVYPQVRTNRRSTLVVVTGGAISFVGDDLTSAKQRFPRHRLIDLEGRTVIPGLVDSHTHFYFWAITLDAVHIDGTVDFDQVIKKIATYCAGRRAGEWIIGDGWSPDRWTTYHLPTAAELDRVTGNRPAALFSKDEHMVWVNSRALELAGIDDKYPDPPGGVIDRDPVTHRPTGILREIPGYFPVVKLISRPRVDQTARFWDEAARIAYSRGVTGFHSVDGPDAWEFFRSLNERGKIGFRVHYYYPADRLDDLIERGITSGMGDDTLRVGGIKVFTDGSLGAQSALMKQPYRGSENNFGVEVSSLPVLTEIIGKASRHGLACAVHAIGDRAVANVITAYEKAGGGGQLRHRIEHLQLISSGDIPRLKKTGVIASMQPTHCPSDRKLVAAYWGARGRQAYIFGTLLRRGIPVTFGSDVPIEPLDPLAGIHAAVNRNGQGERGGRFYQEECLTVAQATAGFTTGPAYASGREAFSGRLLPGYQADITIFNDNIYTMPPSRIYAATVAATMFDGRFVYQDSAFPNAE
ncbi:MAG: amidohydrolase [candidate division Zixibacteria bacterium]|nr:amidohydrolase [candidate division Zixibacteria bacterium]